MSLSFPRLLVPIFLLAAGCSSGSSSPATGSTAPAGCAAPTLDCGTGTCVNVQGDGNNCGSCGLVCAAGTFCSAGTCAAGCPTGTTPCGNSCWNTTNDAANCGGCGIACGVGQACVASSCVASNTGTGTSTSSSSSTTPTGGTGTGFGEIQGAVCANFGAQPLSTAFASLYDAWLKSQTVTCGTGIRVKGCPRDDASGTCSEAMGYGMLLAVGANDQATFNGLNDYRHQMLAASSTADHSLMPWAIWNSKSCPPTATGGDMNSATDGDIDAAMALLQADARWGGGTYRTEALTIIASIKALEITGSGASMKLKPGNQANDSRDYVAYYAPGYFKVFAQVTGDTTWNDLTAAYYTRLLANQCSANGQIYDDFTYPGECKFWWDSCRVPWRVAVDYAWTGDANAKAFLDRLQGFVGTNPAGISDQKNSAFAGGGALSGISNADPNLMQTLCNNWANASGLDDSPYFQKTLKLLYLMVAGGMFVPPITN